MSFRIVARGGTFRQLAVPGTGGTCPEATLFCCRVVKGQYEKNGKTYAVLSLESAAGDVDMVARIDRFILKHAKPAYTPLAGHMLTVKLPGDLKYADEASDPCPPWTLEQDAYVDVVVRPGAFGDFGYCFLIQRIKPHKIM